MKRKAQNDSLCIEFQKKICIRLNDIPKTKFLLKQDDCLMSDINETYNCSLHDNDVSICSIYGCSGGEIVKLKTYNYIS